MSKEFSSISRLNEASFRGIPFIVPDESVSRGQKLAIHEYPNSNKRFAEPLGKIPPIIDLTGIVDGLSATNDDAEQFKDRQSYVEARWDLERALEEYGPGELIHPIYGTIQVQVGEFTVKSNQRKVGEFIFKMQFFSSEEVVPNPLPATENTATFLADSARSDLLDAVEDAYEDPIDSNALEGAVDYVLDSLDTVNDAIDSVVEPVESALAATNTAIAQFRNGVYNIMQTAAGLKANLLNTYNSFLQLSLDPGTLAAAWDNLIDFEGEEKADTNTVSRANRVNNQIVIEEQTQITGLIGGFEAAANTDFSTVEELQERIEDLDEKFTEFFETNEDAILAITPAVRSSVLTLRAKTKEALDDQSSKIWRTSDILTRKTSMSLMAYKYYGNIDNIDTLIDLNPEINVANVEGTVKVVAR